VFYRRDEARIAAANELLSGDLGPASATADVYGRLIADLGASGCRYRLIEHPPEGRTELVSAAKCLILLVKIGKEQTRYVLAVVPGDARLDVAAVKALLGASYVAFADTDKAEELAGSVTGTAWLVPASPASSPPDLCPEWLANPLLHENAPARVIAVSRGNHGLPS
jgi:Aminoacyl-tRNA editing domain